MARQTVGICIFDDVIEHCSPASFKYAEYFLGRAPIYMWRRREVRQAAAYGLGVMAQYGGDNYRQHFLHRVLLTSGYHQRFTLDIPVSPALLSAPTPENSIHCFLLISFANTLLQHLDIYHPHSHSDGNEVLGVGPAPPCLTPRVQFIWGLEGMLLEHVLVSWVRHRSRAWRLLKAVVHWGDRECKSGGCWPLKAYELM